MPSMDAKTSSPGAKRSAGCAASAPFAKSSFTPYAPSSRFATSAPQSGIESATRNCAASRVRAFSTESRILFALFSPKPSMAAISSQWSPSR